MRGDKQGDVTLYLSFSFAKKGIGYFHAHHMIILQDSIHRKYVSLHHVGFQSLDTDIKSASLISHISHQ